LGELLLDDLVAQLDALDADVHARARDEPLRLLLGLAAEGALEQVAAFAYARHLILIPLAFPPGRRDRSTPPFSPRRSGGAKPLYAGPFLTGERARRVSNTPAGPPVSSRSLTLRRRGAPASCGSRAPG